MRTTFPILLALAAGIALPAAGQTLPANPFFGDTRDIAVTPGGSVLCLSASAGLADYDGTDWKMVEMAPLADGQRIAASRNGHVVIVQLDSGIRIATPDGVWSQNLRLPDVGPYTHRYYDAAVTATGTVWVVSALEIPRPPVNGTPSVIQCSEVSKYEDGRWTTWRSRSPLEDVTAGSQDLGTSASLSRLAIHTDSSVWVAGRAGIDLTTLRMEGGLVHWNGTDWDSFTLPTSATHGVFVTDMAVDPDGTVWIARRGDNTSGVEGSLLSWDGSTFSMRSRLDGWLSDIPQLPEGPVWITGIAYHDGSFWFSTNTLGVLAWDGRQVRQYTSANGLDFTTALDAVAVDSTHGIWSSSVANAGVQRLTLPSTSVVAGPGIARITAVDGTVVIPATGTVRSVHCTDVNGRAMIVNHTSDGSSVRVRLEGLRPGMYTCAVETASGLWTCIVLR